jgi:predicted N-acetyltransferase YhbS
VEIRIVHLFEMPESRATVAGWIYDAFWTDKHRHTPQSLESLLQQAISPDCIPISLLALSGDTPVGTVNLIENDDEHRPHLAPWLAALFVLPLWRNQGIGSVLVHTLQEHASRLGRRGMYLGTDNPGFYARRGATVYERVDKDFCIMFLRSDDASVPGAGGAES